MAVVNTSMLRGPYQSAVAFNDRAVFSDDDALFSDQEAALAQGIRPWLTQQDEFD